MEDNHGRNTRKKVKIKWNKLTRSTGDQLNVSEKGIYWSTDENTPIVGDYWKSPSQNAGYISSWPKAAFIVESLKNTLFHLL